jgi:hypothetical protein
MQAAENKDLLGSGAAPCKASGFDFFVCSPTPVLPPFGQVARHKKTQFPPWEAG